MAQQKNKTSTTSKSSSTSQRETATSGTLLINLGSPESTSIKDVRRYLRQFLMDDFVIDVPFLL